MVVDTRSTKPQVSTVIEDNDSNEQTKVTAAETTTPTVASIPTDAFTSITPESRVEYAQGLDDYLNYEKENRCQFNEQPDITFYYKKKPPKPSPERGVQVLEPRMLTTYYSTSFQIRSTVTTEKTLHHLHNPVYRLPHKTPKKMKQTNHTTSTSDFNESLPRSKQDILYECLYTEQRNDLSEIMERSSKLNNQQQCLTTIAKTPKYLCTDRQKARTWKNTPSPLPDDNNSDRQQATFLNKMLRSQPRRTATPFRDVLYTDSSTAYEDEDYRYHPSRTACPSSGYLTKTLMKHATKNSRLKSLPYQANLDVRRQQFNRFIDNLIIVSHISPWTKPLFSDWPNEINCNEPNVSLHSSMVSTPIHQNRVGH